MRAARDKNDLTLGNTRSAGQVQLEMRTAKDRNDLAPGNTRSAGH